MSAPTSVELRAAIIKVVAEESAYQVPSLCEGLGLAAGDADEAFKSKASYVQRRLTKLDRIALEQVTLKLAELRDDFVVSDLAERIKEQGQPEVTGITRRAIAAFLDSQYLADQSESYEDLQLLRRVWPTTKMAAGSHWKDTTADEAILQATVRNSDIGNREVLELLGFFQCSNSQVFKFLLALIDPEFIGKETQENRAKAIGELLRHDGYDFDVQRVISGRNLYRVIQCSNMSPAAGTISDRLAAFDPTQVRPRWQKALDRIDSDPEGAITAARTLLEDVLKWLTDHLGDTWQEKDDLPQLYKRVRDHLNLAPDNHTEESFKTILGNCQSIVASLGSLRNKISDAHSTGPRRVKPAPRHAALAVHLAGAMSSFLIATWESKANVS